MSTPRKTSPQKSKPQERKQRLSAKPSRAKKSAPVASAPAPAAKRDDLQIGGRLKHARLLAGILMRELAVKVGCTESMISKIESGRVVPSLPMLQRLVTALDRDLASFFGTDPNLPGLVLRAGQRPVVHIDPIRQGRQVSYERLVPFGAGHLLEGNIHVIEPQGAKTDPITHQGETLGYVIEGQLELAFDDTRYTVGAGDSFFFKNHLTNRYNNPGLGVTRVLWVNTPQVHWSVCAVKRIRMGLAPHSVRPEVSKGRARLRYLSPNGISIVMTPNPNPYAAVVCAPRPSSHRQLRRAVQQRANGRQQGLGGAPASVHQVGHGLGVEQAHAALQARDDAEQPSAARVGVGQRAALNVQRRRIAVVRPQPPLRLHQAVVVRVGADRKAAAPHQTQHRRIARQHVAVQPLQA